MIMLVFLTCLALISTLLNAHPQCLDGKPPFTSTPPLKFCTEYKDNGCCTAVEDSVIEQRYKNITQSLTSGACREKIKSIFCQQCSPYAAHLYSYEETGVASTLPGLCPSYCAMVYNSCGANSLKLLFGTNKAQETVLQNSSSFCKYVAIADSDYCYPYLKTNPVLTETYTREQSADAAKCMCLQKIATNLSLVTFIEMNPVAIDIMYVGQQSGKILVYQNGVERRRPFLELSKAVLLSKSAGDERGLLGMALHPKYSKNHKFYLYYVINSPEHGQTVRISQWSARTNTVARHRSEKIVLEIPQPFVNHNGGKLLFGEDSYLYIFTGDGGSAGDPLNHGQNLETLLGKALRINVDRRRKGMYTIPPDNPFKGQGQRKEIYAYGLRNPWGCSVDPGDPVTGEGKGRIFCADVGQNKFEEIDIIVRGGNYGWASREGFKCFKTSRRASTCGKIGKEVFPIHVYNHTVGKSITGGYIYRGCEYPEFNGAYIYGDYVSGRLFRLEERERKWIDSEINICTPSICKGNWVSTYGKGITTFGVSNQGDILMSSIGSGGATLYKLIMQPFRRSDPTSCVQSEGSESIPERLSTTKTTNSTPPPPVAALSVAANTTRSTLPTIISEKTGEKVATQSPAIVSPYRAPARTSTVLSTNKALTEMSPNGAPAGTMSTLSLGTTEPLVTLSSLDDPLKSDIYSNSRMARINQLIRRYQELIRQLEMEIDSQKQQFSTSSPSSTPPPYSLLYNQHAYLSDSTSLRNYKTRFNLKYSKK